LETRRKLDQSLSQYYDFDLCTTHTSSLTRFKNIVYFWKTLSPTTTLAL
jgi:hypothetical protein